MSTSDANKSFIMIDRLTNTFFSKLFICMNCHISNRLIVLFVFFCLYLFKKFTTKKNTHLFCVNIFVCEDIAIIKYEEEVIASIGFYKRILVF